MPLEIESKTILNRTKKRDPWFLDDYTLNPYSGCSFNCLYCYIRGSKYGINMEEKLAVKTNAPDLLDKALELNGKKGRYGIIALSSATDPYLQLEKDLKLTRELLKVILKHRFPVHVITKSDLVVRDFDLLSEIEENAILPRDLERRLDRKVFITFSFSTLDDQTAAVFEPGATRPSKRLGALKQAVAGGFLTGVSMMPMLPFITDTGENLHHMFSEFSAAGARYVFPATLTLFGSKNADSKTQVMNAVEKHYPHLVEKYGSYFTESDEMPAFYRNAFTKKMNEMKREFGLPDRFI